MSPPLPAQSWCRHLSPCRCPHLSLCKCRHQQLCRCQHLSLHLFVFLHFSLLNSFKLLTLYGTFKPFRFYFFFSSPMKWPERLGRGGHCKDIYQRSQVSLVFTQLPNTKHESICYKNMLHSKHDLPVFYSRKLFKYFSITFL